MVLRCLGTWSGAIGMLLFPLRRLVVSSKEAVSASANTPSVEAMPSSASAFFGLGCFEGSPPAEASSPGGGGGGGRVGLALAWGFSCCWLFGVRTINNNVAARAVAAQIQRRDEAESLGLDAVPLDAVCCSAPSNMLRSDRCMIVARRSSPRVSLGKDCTS